jgi:hypothetical protein
VCLLSCNVYANGWAMNGHVMVGPAGIEPATKGL